VLADGYTRLLEHLGQGVFSALRRRKASDSDELHLFAKQFKELQPFSSTIYLQLAILP